VPSGEIAAGDFTGDGRADVASCWSSGLYYQNGDTLGWTKVWKTAPYTLTAGDVTYPVIEIVGSYLQYRTYSDPAKSKYRGWVGFENNAQPIDESDIEDIVLKDQDQKEVVIDQIAFSRGDYYFGYWNSGTQQVVYSGPRFYTGFNIYFPEGATFSSGNYTYEATTSQGIKLSDVRYFPGKLELAVVDSSTMASEWINGDLKLTWTNPDPGGPFDEVRVWLFSEENGWEIYLQISLPNTASEVTIPQQWINKVKQLSGTDTMSWCILFNAYESTTNNLYARSISDEKPIDGWSN